MSDRAPDYVYVIYIAARADTVWNGLLDRELTEAYWGHYNVSDWKPGSAWEHVRSDVSCTVDILGKVVEIDPPRRLVISWAFPHEAQDETKVSRVTFELTPLGPDTRLKVIHSDLEPGSEMQKGIADGWPAGLSNLKTLLETGRTLSDDMWSSVSGDEQAAGEASP